MPYRLMNARTLTSEDARQLSRNLDSVANVIANWTVSAIEETTPGGAESVSGEMRRAWLGVVRTQLGYLSQAIACQEPRVFDEIIRWTRTAYSTRHVPEKALRAELRELIGVMRAELPEPLAKVAVPIVQHSLDAFDELEPFERSTLDPDDPLQKLALSYLEALLDGRRDDAESLIITAASAGRPVEDLLLCVLGPAQREIGEMWHAGEITVADEHLATATTEMILSMLRSHFTRGEARGVRLVACTVGGELHAIGARLAADFFEMDGWEVLFLGANMPNEDTIQCLREHRAAALAISATSFLLLREVKDLIDSIRAEPDLNDVLVIVGGQPFHRVPGLWQSIGADIFAESPTQAVEEANRRLDQIGSDISSRG